MRMTLVLLLAPVLFVPLARADSDDLSGGVLLVHAPPGVVYTTGTIAWCDSTHLADCEDQVTTITANTEAVWFVLSAWAEEKSFSAVEFGLGDFDAESFYFIEDGICLDDAMAIHYPSVEDWPGPSTGIALAANGDAWTGQLVPIAWFAGYNYAEADTIAITENPATEHAGWVSGETRTPYDAECLGALGLGVDGTACCPEGELDGQIGEGTAEDQAGTEFDGIDAEESGQDYLPDESGWVDLGDEPVPFDLHLGQSNGSSTVLEMTLDGFFATPVEIEEKTYYALSVAGEPASVDSCLPALPAVSRALMIPNDARMAVRILSSEYIDLPAFPAAPSKGLLMMSVDPDTVPFCFDSLYQSDDPYPNEVARLGRPYIFRDYRGIVVTLNPMQALPATDSLRVYTHLTVEVYPDGVDTINTLTSDPPAFIDRQFSVLYQHLFFNYASAGALRAELPTDDGPMLIICNDLYESHMTPFMEWKRDRGIATDLLTVSDICGSTPNADAIRDTISGRFHSSDRISYVLLVGDSADVPSVLLRPNGTILSDPSYSLIDGTDSYPEVFVGRFSARTSVHVDTQVDRVIDYERDIPENPYWLRQAFCLSTDAISTPDGRDNNTWMEERLHTLDSLGYNVDRLYNPPGGGPEDVAAVINAGIGLMLASNHGDWDHWDAAFPHFFNENIGVLTNVDRLPLIHAHSCKLGMFSHEQCFAETWMWVRQNGVPIGAIAVYMASDDLPQSGPQFAQKGTLELLTSGEMLSVGGLLYGGAVYMLARDPHQENTFKMWHIFGDPSMVLRGNAAPTLCVEPDGSGDYPTIGAAMNAAISGTHILLGDGLFWGDGNRAISCYGAKRNVRLLRKSALPNGVLVNCGGAGFLWMVDAMSKVALEGIAITNSNGLGGNGWVACHDCRFIDNSGELRSGRGLACSQCLFEGNAGWSALVGCESGAITDCIFVDNVVGEDGHVVYAADGLVMERCTLVGNDVGAGEVVGIGDECETELRNSIIAYNDGRGVGCYAGLPHAETTVLGCCDLYGNAGGDWEFDGSGIESQAEENDNLSADPEFCSLENRDLSLFRHSPCLGAVCGQIGAEELGCTDMSVGDDGSPAVSGLLLQHGFLGAGDAGMRLYLAWPPEMEGLALQLHILDVAGRVVRGFPEMVATGSAMVIEWDGRDDRGRVPPAGIYFMAAEAGDWRARSRIVIVK